MNGTASRPYTVGNGKVAWENIFWVRRDNGKNLVGFLLYVNTVHCLVWSGRKKFWHMHISESCEHIE